MEIARVVLDYLRVLVWPAVLVLAIVKFRRPIAAILARVAGQSEELTLQGFGFGIAAKFREKFADLAERSESADADELRDSVKKAARELAHDEFRGLAEYFMSSTRPIRNRVAEQVKQAVTRISLDDLLDFARSINAGERVAAAIGLGVYLEDSAQVRNDPRVLSTLQSLLDDPFSRVRYRAVQALYSCPSDVASVFEEDLQRMTQSDPNSTVRDMAQRVLLF